MLIRLSKSGGYLVTGKVSRNATVKRVGSKQSTLCEFGVYAGKDENGKKIYVNCKAWDELGGVLSELQEYDPFCGIGRLETRENNGKTFSELILEWGNSPMISADVGAIPNAEGNAVGNAPATSQSAGLADFADLEDVDDDLPF